MIQQNTIDSACEYYIGYVQRSPGFVRRFGKWRSRIQCYSPNSKSHLTRDLLAYQSKIISPFHIILLILGLTSGLFNFIGIRLLQYILNNTSRIPNATRMYILGCKHVVTTINRVNVISEIRAPSGSTLPGSWRPDCGALLQLEQLLIGEKYCTT